MNASASTIADSRSAGPMQAFLLLLCGCMAVLASTLIAPILPKMQAHFATMPKVEFLVPVALTAPSLVIAVLALFVGAIADRVGRKRLLVIGLLLYSALGTAPLWLDSLYAILASRFGVGIAEAVIMTCCTTLIGDYFSGLQRERYLALNTTVAATSAVIFMAGGGALGEFGWRVPFAVYAISLPLMIAVVLLLWEPARRPESGPVLMVAEPTVTDWHPRQVAEICVVTIVGAIGFMAIPVHIGYLLEAVGVTSPGVVGLVAAGTQIAVVIGSMLFRLVLRARLSTPIRLALAFGVSGAGFVVAGSATTLVALGIGGAITGFGSGLLLPTLQCWNMSKLPPEHRALGTGAWMAAFFFGQFITPVVVVGVAAQAGGVPKAILYLGFAFLPVTAAFLAAHLLGFRRQDGSVIANEEPAVPR